MEELFCPGVKLLEEPFPPRIVKIRPLIPVIRFLSHFQWF